MLSDDKIIKVSNRDSGTVGYKIDELGGLRRNFAPGESKDISMGELRKLSWTPGGKVILRECLIVRDKEALDELLGEVEPEYFYTEEEVKNLLLNGTLDQFKDCLDFAPDGVIDLIKTLSVKMELNDVSKRKAVLDKTGFNVDRAIEIEKETSEEKPEENNTSRRAEPINANVEEVPVRRTETPITIIE